MILLFLRKYAGLLLIISGLLLAVGSLYSIGKSDGRDEIRALWQASKDKQAYLQAEYTAQEVAKLNKKEAIKQEIINGYQTEVQTITAKRNSLNGMRFTAKCSPTEASKVTDSSTKGVDEGVTSTVVLPEQVAEDLLNLAKEADEVTAMARALQEYVNMQDLTNK